MEKVNIKRMMESVINDLSNNETIQTYALKINLIIRLCTCYIRNY